MRRVAVCSGVTVLFGLLVGGCSSNSADDPADARRARSEMVERLAKGGRISDKRVLDAMRSVRRHQLLDASWWPQAYSDQAIALDSLRALPSPLLSAAIAQELNPLSKHRILLISPQTAYEAAILGKLCSRVVVVVLTEQDCAPLRDQLTKLGATNVDVHATDVAQGWPANAPYDGVLIGGETGGRPSSKLTEQMASHGVLVEYNGPYAQRVVVYRMQEHDLALYRTVNLG